MRIFRPLKSATVLHGLVGAHLLEAVVPETQAGDALGFEHAEQFLADVAVHHPVQGFLVGEDVGQIEQFEGTNAQRAELGQGRGQHLHGADLQGLHLFRSLYNWLFG
jgi:hypothetical protein